MESITISKVKESAVACAPNKEYKEEEKRQHDLDQSIEEYNILLLV